MLHNQLHLHHNISIKPRAFMTLRTPQYSQFSLVRRNEKQITLTPVLITLTQYTCARAECSEWPCLLYPLIRSQLARPNVQV